MVVYRKFCCKNYVFIGDFGENSVEELHNYAISRNLPNDLLNSLGCYFFNNIFINVTKSLRRSKIFFYFFRIDWIFEYIELFN